MSRSLVHLPLLLASLAAVLVNCQLEKNNRLSWSYNDQEAWKEQFPECKISPEKHQSPIDIVTENIIIRPEYELDFIDYDQQVEFQLKNNHHTISATPVSATKPSVRLSWLEDCDFELNEVHFHWGDGHFKGSEHEINGQKAAAEMHLVHIRKGLTKDDIGYVDNSVVVIGVFIESDSVEHSKINSLIDDASYVNGTDSEFLTNDSSHLINLLPYQHTTFYTYNGSLTTPPCYEVVTWVMMSQPVYMTNERLIELSNVESLSSDGERIKINSNWRDIQPLGDRNVYASFHTKELVSPQYTEMQRPETGAGGRFRNAFEEFWRRINAMRKSMGLTRSRTAGL